jgi:hypothetical protein
MMRLESFIDRAPEEFFRTVNSLESATAEEMEAAKDIRLSPILDSILTTAIEAAGHEAKVIPSTRAAYYRIYERAERASFPEIAEVELDKIWVWGEVIKRVYLLGAVMVERRRFASAAALIDQPVTWDSHWSDRLWARHALTMLARTQRLDRKGLVSLTAVEIDREPWFLHPFGGDKERALNALCQFDFLQCVHVAHRSTEQILAYPSFSQYYNWRTEPIVASLIGDAAVRRDAIPEMDDSRLADIIVALDELAGREAFLVAGWDSNSWSDLRIRRFLDKHHD